MPRLIVKPRRRSTGGLAAASAKKGRDGPHRTRPWLADEGPLSTRELEIIDMVVEGLSNKEIAKRCDDVREDTIKKHLYNIFSKTGCETRLQLGLKYTVGAPGRDEIALKVIGNMRKQQSASARSLITSRCDQIEALVREIRTLNGEKQ